MVSSTAALSLLATASLTLGATRPEVRDETKKSPVIPGAYIIEFEEGANADTFRVQAEPSYETRQEFNYELFKGVSIQLDVSDTPEERAAQLAELPAVKNLWPVKVIDRFEPLDHGSGRTPSAETSRPDRGPGRGPGRDNSAVVERGLHDRSIHRRQSNDTSLGNAPHVMTQVDKLHDQGLTGKGIKIAVIDSGIDYDHPALGGCFGEGCLVSFGYDLVGDDYEAGGQAPVPDSDPDDTCDGHGTHVAGIIAAKGDTPFGISGVAPGVTLGAYRVFGCGGGTASDVLIDAFNMAYEDGADIITASIGGINGWSGEPWAVAVSRIADKGVPCTLAAGNSGAGLFLSSTAADGKGVTAIASFQNTNLPIVLQGGVYSINNGSQATFEWEWGYPETFDGVERELWVTGYDITNDSDACEPLPDDTPDLSDYVVLFRQSSTCDYLDQGVNLAAKGARFVAMYSDSDAVPWIDLEYWEGTENIEGAATVPKDVGESWVKALEAGKTVTATFEHHEDAKDVILIKPNNDDAGALSYFTSWGPTKELDMKPQFGAPGGNILSTYPVELGGYAPLSGTSMSTPYVAGAYALLAEARGEKPDARLFEKLFSSTSKPHRYHNFGTGYEDYLAPAAQQGAGLIQVLDAVLTTAYLEPTNLAWNDTEHFVDTLHFTIVNDGDEDITYEVTHVPTISWYSLDTDETNFPWVHDSAPEHADLAFGSSAVTVAAGDSVSVDVTATPPEGLNGRRYPYWSGYVFVNGSDGSSLTLPYQGLSGSLNDAVLTDAEGPTLVTDYLHPDVPLAPNTTFTFPAPGANITDETPLPEYFFRLIWGTPQLAIEVVQLTPQGDDKVLGNVPGYPATLVPESIAWDVWIGQLATGEYAPAGRYKIVVRILSIYGDASNDDDWTVVESVPFGIRYAEAEESE